MMPPLPADRDAHQTIFHIADSKKAADTVNLVVGKILSAIHMNRNGVLLQFHDALDYLMILGGRIPVFGQPYVSSPGEFQMDAQSARLVVAVSLSGAGMRIDPGFWPVWQDESAQLLVGQMLTGYSPSISHINGMELPSAMLEFTGDLFLAVTPMGADVLKRDKPLSIS